MAKSNACSVSEVSSGMLVEEYTQYWERMENMEPEKYAEEMAKK